MHAKTPTRSTVRKLAHGKRHKDLEELRPAVHAACWEELRLCLGPGPWESKLQTLTRFIADPDDREKKARVFFARLRSVMLDIVAIGEAYEAEQRRLLDALAWEPTNAIATVAPGGECVRLLSGLVMPALLPIMNHPKMAVPREWFDLPESQADYSKLCEMAERDKKKAPRWQLRKRSRLVELLEALDLLDLPPRSDPPNESRFLSPREYALMSLILNIGVLDEPTIINGYLKGPGISVATVVGLEEERMRMALSRHSRWERRAKAWKTKRPRRGP